jgi:hypothetical protein
MTPEQIEKERAAFEAWMDELYPTNPQTGRVGDEYSRLGTQYKWEGWQAKAAQSEWISVNDRLPELNKEVLVAWSNGSVGISRHIKDEFEPTEWDTYGSHVNITHWQPLPEPIQNSTDE